MSHTLSLPHAAASDICGAEHRLAPPRQCVLPAARCLLPPLPRPMPAHTRMPSTPRRSRLPHSVGIHPAQRQWRTGTGGLCTELVDASRYFRKTRGGSTNPLDMMSGGSVQPLCSALCRSGERAGIKRVGVGRHVDAPIISAGFVVIGRAKGWRKTGVGLAIGIGRGVSRGEAKAEAGSLMPPARCSLMMRCLQNSASRAWLSGGNRAAILEERRRTNRRIRQPRIRLCGVSPNFVKTEVSSIVLPYNVHRTRKRRDATAR